jgi:hypothetical protein
VKKGLELGVYVEVAGRQRQQGVRKGGQGETGRLAYSLEGVVSTPRKTKVSAKFVNNAGKSPGNRRL